METKLVQIGIDGGAFTCEDEAYLRQAAEIIKKGGLVAFPTETVYGLGGDALNPDSSRKIYAAKGRPSDNPLIVHISSFEDIRKIVRELPETAVKIADTFWPGPSPGQSPGRPRAGWTPWRCAFPPTPWRGS